MMHKIENSSELSSIVFQQKGNELVLIAFFFTSEGKLYRKRRLTDKNLTPSHNIH